MVLLVTREAGELQEFVQGGCAREKKVDTTSKSLPCGDHSSDGNKRRRERMIEYCTSTDSCLRNTTYVREVDKW